MASNEEVLLLFKGVDNVSNTANSIKKNVEGIGNSATGIGGKVQGIASSFDMVSASITGVVGGLSLASMATEAWEGATEKQMNQLLLARKYPEEAERITRDIANVVKDTPGDDSFLTSMLSNASLQAKMTTTDLEDMAKAISDYTIMSQAAGSTSFESQGEIRNYLMTGETGRMKDTALAPYLDKMENATTVTERVQTLNDALHELGYEGASDLGSAANSMETFKGTMQQALTSVGEKFLPIVQTILDGFLSLDEALGGNLSTGLVIVGGGLAALTTGAGILGATLPAITSGFEIMGGVLPAINGMLGVQAAETTALTSEEIALAAAQAGLTTEEIAAAAAHSGNIGILAAEGVAATEAGGAFGFLGVMELGAVWPILLIIAAVAALIVIVEQIGESLGWWTDFSTMLDAIRAGVMRLWDAFVNSPQVQGTLSSIQGAVQALWGALQPIFNWLTSAWNNLFQSEGAGSGGPDIVGQLISLFGQLGSVAGDVVNTIVNFGTQVYTALSPIIGLVSNIVNIFGGMLSGQIGIQQGIMMILQNVSQVYAVIGNLVLQIGQRILTGIVNALRPIPQRIWQFLLQAALRILLFGAMAAIRARQAGMRILNGIINYIRQLPGRVGAYMMQVPGRIAAAAGAAVGAAASLASQVVSAVVSGVTGVADAVYNEFVQIGSRINQAVSSAVSAATSFGSDIKNAVLGALGIASPGIIQKKIAIEFQDIPGRIGESNDYVYSAARDYAGNIMRGFNAPRIPLGTVRQNTNYTPTNQVRNMTIIHVHENAVPIDARNMTKDEATGVVTLAFENIGRNNNPQGGAS